MAISRTSVRRPEDTEGAGHTASALERAFEKAGWTLFDDDDDDDGHLLLEGEDEDVRFAAEARDRGGQESDDGGSDIIDDTDEDTEGDVLRDLRAALEKGLVSREEHDEALRRILRPAMLLRAAAATTTGATDLALLAAIAGPESVQAEDPPTSPAKRPKVTASFPSSPTSVLRKQEPPLWQDDDKPTLLQPDATIRRKIRDLGRLMGEPASSPDLVVLDKASVLVRDIGTELLERKRRRASRAFNGSLRLMYPSP